MAINSTNSLAIAFNKLSGKVHTQQNFAVTEEGISTNVQMSYSTVFAKPIVKLPVTASGMSALYATNGIVERVKFQIDIIPDTQIAVGKSQGYRLKLPSDYNTFGELYPKFSAGTYLHTALGKLQIVPSLYGTLKPDGSTEYDPILYQTNGSTVIPKFDPINWYFDPYSGILFIQDPPAGYDISATRPGYLEAFLYVGEYLDDIIFNIGTGSTGITAVNVGTGIGIFKDKIISSGGTEVLRFKSLVGLNGIAVSGNSNNVNISYTGTTGNVSGTTTQIPFVNGSQSGYSYDSNLSFAQTTNRFKAGRNLSITAGSGVVDHVMMFGTDHLISGNTSNIRWSTIFGEANKITATGSAIIGNSSILGGNSNVIKQSGANTVFNAMILGGAFNTIAATGDSLNSSFAMGRYNEAHGTYSIAWGWRSKATGPDSIAFGATKIGDPDAVPSKVLASGRRAINISTNSSGQTIGHGARGNFSVILGGWDSDVPTGSTNSVIIGGQGIKVQNGVTNTVHLPKVRIGLGSNGSITTGSTSQDVLMRNQTNGEIELRKISSLINFSSAQRIPFMNTGGTDFNYSSGFYFNPTLRNLVIGTSHTITSGTDYVVVGGSNTVSGGGWGVVAGENLSVTGGGGDLGLFGLRNTTGRGGTLTYGTDNSNQNANALVGGSGAKIVIGPYGNIAGISIGIGDNPVGVGKEVYAFGGAVNISTNDSSQTIGHGAKGFRSVILGGLNHNIDTGSTNSIIIGGNTIKVGTGVTNTVHMPKLRIGLGIGGSLVSGSTSNQMLVRNVITGEIELRTYTGGTGGSGSTITASNGLNKFGDDIRLGGAINSNITFTPSSPFSYGIQFGDTGNTFSQFEINTGVPIADVHSKLLVENANILLRVDPNLTTFSQLQLNGSVSSLISKSVTKYNQLYVNNEGIKLEIFDIGNSVVTDSIRITETGSTVYLNTGNTFQYADDYSINFNARSIPDVAYVTGLSSTVSNGLTKIGNNVRLGGTLTGTTKLNLNSNNLIITGSTVTLPKVKIGLGTGGALVTGSTSTSLLVRNSSTGDVELRNKISLSKSLFVDLNGDDSTAIKGSVDNPYKTLLAARNAATSGDTIFVFPGLYTENTNCAKNLVDWYFYDGAVIKPSITGTSIFNTNSLGAVKFGVYGKGTFISFGVWSNDTTTFVISNSGTSVYIEAKSISSLEVWRSGKAYVRNTEFTFQTAVYQGPSGTDVHTSDCTFDNCHFNNSINFFAFYYGSGSGSSCTLKVTNCKFTYTGLPSGYTQTSLSHYIPNVNVIAYTSTLFSQGGSGRAYYKNCEFYNTVGDNIYCKGVATNPKRVIHTFDNCRFYCVDTSKKSIVYDDATDNEVIFRLINNYSNVGFGGAGTVTNQITGSGFYVDTNFEVLK